MTEEDREEDQIDALAAEQVSLRFASFIWIVLFHSFYVLAGVCAFVAPEPPNVTCYFLLHNSSLFSSTLQLKLLFTQAREQKRNNNNAATAMQIDNFDESPISATTDTAAVLGNTSVTNNNSSSGTNSTSSAAPLKLSLSVRRPTATTATTDDTTLLQDEENDLNNADNAESNAQEGEQMIAVSCFFFCSIWCISNSACQLRFCNVIAVFVLQLLIFTLNYVNQIGSDHESEQGDNQADAFEVDDSGDEGEGEHDQEDYPPYDGHQYDTYKSGSLSPYASHSSAPHTQFSAQSSTLRVSHSTDMPVQVEEEENESSDDDIETLLQARRQSETASSGQYVGSEGAENTEETENKETEREDDQDKDSVNSEDSDAWMNEA